MSIINNELAFHLKIKKGDVGEYVILPGDPGRVPKIAKYLDNVVQIAQNREFSTYTGTLQGVKVSIVSTGIGGASAAIAIEELVDFGANTFIRIGTSGGMDLAVTGGDLVVATAAVRAEGTSCEYMPIEYPAVANFDVVAALKEAAVELSTNVDGNRFHVGVVQSKDSFYGEVRPETMPISEQLERNFTTYIKCGCLATEMESAAIFTVATVRHVRAGSVFTAIWNAEKSRLGLPNVVTFDSERAIKCSILAVKKLIEQAR